MGIRSLNTVIKKFAPDCIIEHDIKSLSGKKIAIDCSILIYKYVHMSKVENSHIIGFANRVNYYMKNNILPIFVFDGTPPDAKKNVLQKRQNNRKKIQDKIDDLKDTLGDSTTNITETQAEIDKLTNQVVYVNKYHSIECKKFLECIGIPYIQADGEAEKTCVYLKKINIVDYVVSDDTDTLTFGCENVLKTSIKGNIQEIVLSRLLQDFEMSYTEFVDFCILSGCDYCPLVPSVGPLTSYALIKKHKNIENVINLNKYKFPDNFDFQTARGLFTQYNDMTINQDELIKKDMNKIELRKFLESLNFSEPTIEKYISIFN
jgi:flap endonuclease-1